MNIYIDKINFIVPPETLIRDIDIRRVLQPEHLQDNCNVKPTDSKINIRVGDVFWHDTIPGVISNDTGEYCHMIWADGTTTIYQKQKIVSILSNFKFGKHYDNWKFALIDTAYFYPKS